MCRNSGSTVATVLPLRACSWSGIRGEKGALSLGC